MDREKRGPKVSRRRGPKVSRRDFVKLSGAGLASAEVLVRTPRSARSEERPAEAKRKIPTREITVTVNGRPLTLLVEPRWTLAFLLREKLRLTGLKVGCDQAACGFCTVLVDGMEVYSCNMLAVDLDGREILTIEGLSRGYVYDDLHPVQKKFIDHMGFQCAFCTSGQILTAVTLVDGGRKDLDLETVRWHQRGVLCRCGCYPKIFKAILEAAAVKGYKDPEKIDIIG